MNYPPPTTSEGVVHEGLPKLHDIAVEAVLETTVPDIKKAMDELSEKLDVIFGKAIKDYCDSEHVEASIDDIPTYKTMNKMIAEKLDILIGEQIKEKRKNL